MLLTKRQSGGVLMKTTVGTYGEKRAAIYVSLRRSEVVYDSGTA
jgi:hypothetical protein